MYANYYLKPVKLIIARLVVVKVLYFLFTSFFSFAEASSLLSEASKLSEKSLSANQNFAILEKQNGSCSKLGKPGGLFVA